MPFVARKVSRRAPVSIRKRSIASIAREAQSAIAPSYVKHRPIRFRRGRDSAFALMVEQTLERSRGAIDRHRESLAHDGHGDIDVLYPSQDTGHEVASFETRGIPTMSQFIVCGSVDVVENRPRQTPPSKLPEIMEVTTVA
jgi:hypothetical protein